MAKAKKSKKSKKAKKAKKAVAAKKKSAKKSSKKAAKKSAKKAKKAAKKSAKKTAKKSVKKSAKKAAPKKAAKKSAPKKKAAAKPAAPKAGGSDGRLRRQNPRLRPLRVGRRRSSPVMGFAARPTEAISTNQTGRVPPKTDLSKGRSDHRCGLFSLPVVPEPAAVRISTIKAIDSAALPQLNAVFADS